MKKRILTLTLTGMFVLSSMGMVVQAESIGSSKAASGIARDSALYPVQKLINSMKLLLSVGNVSKAKTLLAIADEKLAQSELMVDKDKDELAKEAVEEATKDTEEAAKKLDAEEKKAEAKNDVKKKEDIDKLQISFKDKLDAHLAVLEAVRDKMDEDSNAYKVLDRVIDMQDAKKNAVHNYVLARHEYNDIKETGTKEEIAAAQGVL